MDPFRVFIKDIKHNNLHHICIFGIVFVFKVGVSDPTRKKQESRLLMMPRKRRRFKPVFADVKIESSEKRFEFRLLRHGLTSEPTSLNVIAKRLKMDETDENLEIIRTKLECLLDQRKVFKTGARYGIDFAGALELMRLMKLQRRTIVVRLIEQS